MKPVTVVATVNSQKIAVKTGGCRELNSANMMMKPLTIAISVIAT
jgi:hypothetical protein